MEADEIQAAIDRVETKRKELVDTQPAAKESAKILAALPRAADSLPPPDRPGARQRSARSAQGARDPAEAVQREGVRLMQARKASCGPSMPWNRRPSW